MVKLQFLKPVCDTLYETETVPDIMTIIVENFSKFSQLARKLFLYIPGNLAKNQLLAQTIFLRLNFIKFFFDYVKYESRE